MNFSFFFGVFFFGFLMVFIGVFLFVVQRFHFLMSLLSLEFMILGLLMIIFSFVGWSSEGFMLFIILTFASCEAALGLGLLVSLIRSHGNDFISILSIYEC